MDTIKLRLLFNSPRVVCAFLLMMLFLLAQAGFQAQAESPESGAPDSGAYTRIERLCGKLVFLKDRKTNYQTIGLQPCGGARPYVFGARPKELHNYYQFWEVKIGSGEVVHTAEWGNLSTYIVSFEYYIPLNHCGECGKAVVATHTPTLAPTSATQFTPTITLTRQYPPTPTPWEQAASPSPTLAATLAAPASSPTASPSKAAAGEGEPGATPVPTRTQAPQITLRVSQEGSPAEGALALLSGYGWILALGAAALVAAGALVGFFVARRRRSGPDGGE